MVSEAKKRTNMAYDREHTKLIGMKLNLKTDADILAFLATKENVQGYLKNLIRKDMKGATKMSNWDYIVSLMDDEIREAVHADLAPCTEDDFLAEYAKRHLEKYGKEFTY